MFRVIIHQGNENPNHNEMLQYTVITIKQNKITSRQEGLWPGCGVRDSWLGAGGECREAQLLWKAASHVSIWF